MNKPRYSTPFHRSAITLLAISTLAGCSIQFGGGGGKQAKDASKKESAPLVIPVEASAPERGNISTYFETSTRIEAERRVDVASKGSARCVKLMADEGDEVTAGDILAELDQAMQIFVVCVQLASLRRRLRR